MAIDLHWVPYADATPTLHRAVAAAKGGAPLAPVTVVVPSNHVGVASRRLLSSGALGPVAPEGIGLAAVSFVTTYRLAELLGAAPLAAAGRRPVSTPVLAAAARAELTAAPGLFGPVAEHPATESALVATYRELRDLSPTALDALAATSGRAQEVVRLHRAVRGRVVDAWYDEEDLLAAAADAIGPAADLGAVVIHLPQQLTQHGARLLRALAEHVPTTVVAGTCGDDAADREVRRSLQRLGLEAPAPGSEPAPTGSAQRTRIITTSDADEEVRAAVRAIVDAVRAGTRLDRIAVLHASPVPYARLAHEQLHAANIPTNGASVVPLGARVAGRTLLELLALPSGGFRRQDVFAWLTSAPVLHQGRLAPTTGWERLSRDAAVVAGRLDWDVRLTQHALQCEARAEEATLDDEAPEWLPDRMHEQAERARALHTFVVELIDDLTRAADAPRSWGTHATWARRWLDRLLGGPSRREHWDQAEQRAAERVEVALERLAGLDSVEASVPLEVFHRTLVLELEQDLGRVGRFGDGVLVGSVGMGIGLDLDLVIVLGLAEGSFPATVHDDSLLPDHERVATNGELGLRNDLVERQHRQLLASLAGATRQVLCVPRGDLRRSVERVPSRWVLDVCSEIEGTGRRWAPNDLVEAEVPWVGHVASFEHGLRAQAVPATAQELRLRSLLATGDVGSSLDARTAQGAAVLAARRSNVFTRFDGNLAGQPVPSPVEGTTSPTRLERWAICPHQALVEGLLHAAPVENPEENLMITALDRGSLVHAAFEQFIRMVLARTDAARPQPGTGWTDEDRRLLREIGAALCDQYEAKGLTGRALFWRRDRREILEDLDEALRLDAEHRIAHRTAPFAAELGFGFERLGDLPGVELRLPDERTVRVRGRIDRVDRADDGSVHVVDYKTGRPTSQKELDADPVVAGTRLQLPIYGLAGRLAAADPEAPVRAEYWFATRKGGFKRVGYEVDDEVLQTTADVVHQIVVGVEGGVFPPHPRERSTRFYVECHTCDPDGLGTAELRRQWERKRHDPVLAGYADLVEPLDA